MKKSSLAVAALLTTLSAATIVPVAFADQNDSQVSSGQTAGCSGSSGCQGKCKGNCSGKSTDGSAPTTSTDGTDSGS